MKAQNHGLKRIFDAFSYSMQGLKATFETECAFRQDIIVFIVLSGILILCPFSITQKMILFFSQTLILIMELVNTAIEVVVDRIGADYHLLSKKAKDIGSSLVLMSFCLCAILWLMALVQVF